MNNELVKIIEPKAQDIYQRYELSKEAAQFKNEEIEPSGFMQYLISQHLYQDAITFLAHAIPKREGIWWACLSCRDVLSVMKDDKALYEEYLETLSSAESWVIDPTEENRRRAEKLSQVLDYELPASWAALAAFWSQGSITKPDEPNVDAPDFLYAHAISGAVSLAATRFSPDDIDKKMQFYIAIGLDLAKGGKGRLSMSDKPLEGAL